jgi:hypothetical protein
MHVDEWGGFVSELARQMNVNRAHLLETLKGRRSAPLSVWYFIATELEIDCSDVPGLLLGDV